MGLTSLTTILLILITVGSFYLRDWYVPYTGEHIDLVRTYAKIIGVFAVRVRGLYRRLSAIGDPREPLAANAALCVTRPSISHNKQFTRCFR